MPPIRKLWPANDERVGEVASLDLQRLRKSFLTGRVNELSGLEAVKSGRWLGTLKFIYTL